MSVLNLNKVLLQNSDDTEAFYPQTSTDIVFDENGENVDTLLSRKANKSHTHSKSEITDMPTKLSQFTNDTKYQTEAEVAATVAALVDQAPETMDTLNELSAALGDDPNFATTVSNQIGTKANKTDVYTKEETNPKTSDTEIVHKVQGNTENTLKSYVWTTKQEESILTEIAAVSPVGDTYSQIITTAPVNGGSGSINMAVNSDNKSSGIRMDNSGININTPQKEINVDDIVVKTELDTGLSNKADVNHAHLLADFAQDMNHKLVTQQQINIWDDKASKTVATVAMNGLMAATDKVKLNAIEEGANKTIVDVGLNADSTNPVQNKAIYTHMQNKADKASVGDLSSLTTVDKGSLVSAINELKADLGNSKTTAQQVLNELA